MNKVMLIGNVGKDPDILCLMVPKCQTIQIGTILFFIVGLQR